MNCTLLLAMPAFAMKFSRYILSVINLAAVSHRVNRDGVALHREHDAPIARPQSHSTCAFERFHVADTGFRKRRQLLIELRARRGRELAPLAGSGGREFDRLHEPSTSHNAIR